MFADTAMLRPHPSPPSASAFEEEIGNGSNESIASVEALSKAVPRNLLFPRYHRGLSRIEYLAPDHEVRITENCGEGFFSSYIGAVCAAVDGIGWPYSLRRQGRKELNSAQWRADFLQAGGSQQEYEDYMEGIADPGWWGDRQSLLVLRHRCGHPIVVVTERAKWLEVEWADEADREKFERGELDEVVLGIWREGNVTRSCTEGKMCRKSRRLAVSPLLSRALTRSAKLAMRSS